MYMFAYHYIILYTLEHAKKINIFITKCGEWMAHKSVTESNTKDKTENK